MIQNFCEDGKISQYLSDGAKDLIKRLLTLDAKVRPTATQILTHTWIKNGHQLPEVNLAAMGTMNSNQMSKAVGSSISIINSSRSNGKAPGLQLQTPKSSGKKLPKTNPNRNQYRSMLTNYFRTLQSTNEERKIPWRLEPLDKSLPPSLENTHVTKNFDSLF